MNNKHETAKTQFEKGFTLLEVLIVSALMALITGLFIDPIARVYKLRSELRYQIDSLHLSVLAQNWFRSTISGLYMSKSKFVGEEKKITGVTFAPLDDEIGLPTSFEWSLFYDKDNDVTLLKYKGYGEETITTAEWKGDEGSFSYYDPENQNWQNEWQSSSTISEDDYKLPLYVRLDGKLNRKPWIVLATIDPSRPYQRSPINNLKKIQEEMKERIKRENEAKEAAKEDTKQKSKFILDDKKKKKDKDDDE